MKQAHLYFDFVSPYAWLGLERAERLVRDGWTFDLRPIVYAKLLDATGLVGPAETTAKRKLLFFDVARQAAGLGLELTGPPAHPFRSLEALRTMIVHREHERSLSLALALARAAWVEGRDLTNLETIQAVLAEQGVESGDLAEDIAAPEVKEALVQETSRAIERGVFGVPTFEWGEELFWGQDRVGDLVATASGRLAVDRAAIEAILARPVGARRSGA
ncbi:MAG: 2-hydroxychromene-2-carboxylate isomerase [Planctomycetota bacterium]